MSNHHLQHKNLSLKAKGLLSYMLSLPEDLLVEITYKKEVLLLSNLDFYVVDGDYS